MGKDIACGPLAILKTKVAGVAQCPSVNTCFFFCIVSVHCREDGCIRLYIPEDQEISRGPRDVPRAKPEGHLEGQGKS